MKKTIFALLHKTRILRLVAWMNRNKVSILCYHSVTERPDPQPNDLHKLHLQRERFVAHVDYIQSHYRIIALADFVRARREKSDLPPGAAILTFDDGYRNFLSVVAPILLERGIPATSFIVTGSHFTHQVSEPGGQWSLMDDDSHMSWNEIRQLAGAGIEFGSHTATHAPLSDIPPAEAQAELQDSLNALSSNLALTNVSLSYPHGKTSEAVNKLAESVGYACALTTALGQNDANCDLFALKRTVISADDDVPTLAARLSGLTWWWGLARGLTPASATAALPADHPRYDPFVASNPEV